MGRKNLLKGLMDAAAEAPKPGASRPAPQRQAKGAIGAVSQSIAELKSRAIVEIEPELIDAGGLIDRLEHSEADHAALVASIRDYGQQVPVLLRPHPEAEGRYQVVYGRRRILALRELGLGVKSMIRDLDDRQTVLAQGQENSARRDLSFIEKVNFARQMRDAGYDRKTICDALDIDKTLISRMLSVADRAPVAVIEAIGAAAAIGRGRWLEMADLIQQAEWEADALVALAVGETSEDRFEALLASLKAPERRARAIARAAEAPEQIALTTDGGRRIGAVKRAKGRVVLTFREDEAAGFERWLVDNMQEIHRDWMNRRGG